MDIITPSHANPNVVGETSAVSHWYLNGIVREELVRKDVSLPFYVHDRSICP